MDKQICMKFHKVRNMYDKNDKTFQKNTGRMLKLLKVTRMRIMHSNNKMIYNLHGCMHQDKTNYSCCANALIRERWGDSTGNLSCLVALSIEDYLSVVRSKYDGSREVFFCFNSFN